MKINTNDLIYTALCITLGLILPFIFHAVGLGSNFLPMFLPVLLCGFCFGSINGLICGVICPFLSSVITGMPPLFPTALVMTLQCSIFGLVGGELYNHYKLNIYLALLVTLFLGELVGGLFTVLLVGLNSESLIAFMSTYFLNGMPGIILDIVIIPVLVFALKKAKITSRVNFD